MAPPRGAEQATGGGRELYGRKCASCHRLFSPEEYTAKQWQAAVAKFGRGLTAAEQAVLLDYLRPLAAGQN